MGRWEGWDGVRGGEMEGVGWCEGWGDGRGDKC